jgi:hypothetical protein
MMKLNKVVLFLILIFSSSTSAMDLKPYVGWAPEIDANCVNATLVSSGEMEDLVYVDTDTFDRFVLPYCYREIPEMKLNSIVVGYIDWQHPDTLWHIFYVDQDRMSLNKMGTSPVDKYEFKTADELLIDTQKVLESDGKNPKIKYFERIQTDNCPLNNFEEKLRSYVKDPEFYEGRKLLRLRVAQKNSDMDIKAEVPDSFCRFGINLQVQLNVFKNMLKDKPTSSAEYLRLSEMIFYFEYASEVTRAGCSG